MIHSIPKFLAALRLFKQRSGVIHSSLRDEDEVFKFLPRFVRPQLVSEFMVAKTLSPCTNTTRLCRTSNYANVTHENAAWRRLEIPGEVTKGIQGTSRDQGVSRAAIWLRSRNPAMTSVQELVVRVTELSGKELQVGIRRMP